MMKRIFGLMMLRIVRMGSRKPRALPRRILNIEIEENYEIKEIKYADGTVRTP